jgi:hypothetical protein
VYFVGRGQSSLAAQSNPEQQAGRPVPQRRTNITSVTVRRSRCGKDQGSDKGSRCVVFLLRIISVVPLMHFLLLVKCRQVKIRFRLLHEEREICPRDVMSQPVRDSLGLRSVRSRGFLYLLALVGSHQQSLRLTRSFLFGRLVRFWVRIVWAV